jgi:hypothetical protein
MRPGAGAIHAVIVLACLAFGAWPIVTPAVGADIAVERAVDHVEFIAREPHPMGTPAIARVRDYLVATLLDMGLTPETQTVAAPDYYSPPSRTVAVTNVMARIAGTDDDDAVLLMAHYDTVPTTPGANDNAAAVAALLETGRALAEDPPPNDVILLFTDGEEPTPRYGAAAFTDHPWFPDVKLAINFEAIGVGGPSLLVGINGPAQTLAHRLASSTAHPAAFSFLTKTAELIGGDTSDFDVIVEAGIPGYNFAYMRGSSVYHTERDAAPSLHRGGMAHHASLALGVARDFGRLELGGDAGEAVFFTIPGWVVVNYSGAAATASALLALVLLAWVLVDRIRRRESSISRLAAGTGLAAGGGLAAVLATTIIWMGIVAWRDAMGIAESYTWLLLLIAGLIGFSHLIRRRSQRSGSDIAGGVALIWGLLAILTGIWLQSMSYLFVWPAIAAGLVVLARPRTTSRTAKHVALAALTLPTAVLLTPAVDTFFQFAQPRPGNPGSGLPTTIAVPMLVVMLAVGLISSTTSPDRRQAAAADIGAAHVGSPPA